MSKKLDETPSVYVTPDSDADDVAGHKVRAMVRDAAPDSHKNDSAPDILARVTDDDDDVEGHKVR